MHGIAMDIIGELMIQDIGLNMNLSFAAVSCACMANG